MHLRLNVKREVIFLLIYMVLCTLAMIGPGTSMGYSSVVLPVLTSNTSSITLNATEIPLFASLPIICQIVGCLLSLVTMKYGRRCAMIVANVTCSSGWIVIASSYSVMQLFAGRMLTGVAVGLCSTPVAVYLEEISTASWRESLTIIASVSLSFGIVIVYVLGFSIQDDWRLIAALCVIPPTLSVLCTVFFVPESPGWLLTKDRKQAARSALLRLRGLHQETAEFQEEFARMVTYNELRNDHNGSRQDHRLDAVANGGGRSSLTSNVLGKLKATLETVRLPEVWKPLLILNAYFLFQQFSGLYVITVYAVNMVVNAKVTVDPFLITVIIGIVQVVVGTISACCSTMIGRRIISIVSGVGMSISLGVLGVYMQFFQGSRDASAVPVACILIFVASGSFGFLVLPWAMIGELYPTKYVSVLGPVTTFFASLFNFTAVQLYPTMVTQDEQATIYFYCSVSVIATVYLALVLPETRGKTKSQIEKSFRDSSWG